MGFGPEHDTPRSNRGAVSEALIGGAEDGRYFALSMSENMGSKPYFLPCSSGISSQLTRSLLPIGSDVQNSTPTTPQKMDWTVRILSLKLDFMNT